MVGITEKSSTPRQQTETWQFRLLIAIAFSWFFAAAVGSKLMLRTPEGCAVGESCFKAAKRNAYNAVPYAFARI